MKPTHRQLAKSHAFISGIACCCLILLMLMLFLFACYGQVYPAIAAWLTGICAFLMTMHHAAEASRHKSMTAFDNYKNENTFQ